MSSFRDSGRKQEWIEWGFVGSLFILCGILTLLQNRWTGELSRMEAARLRAGLAEQGQALTRSFDAELSSACAALRPSREELEGSDPETATGARWKDWQSTHPRPMFRRVLVAIPSSSGIRLLDPESKTASGTTVDWPPDWSAPRNYVERVVRGGPPVFVDRQGEFLEFPVFSGRGAGPGGESGWLLLQLDISYIRDTWLPELLRQHLGINGTVPYDILITGGTTNQVLYSSQRGSSVQGDPAFSTSFHRLGRSSDPRRIGREPGPSGRSGGPPGMDAGVWTLRIWTRTGELEDLVAGSRQRNFAIAIAVNGLILAAGILLVLHTRRSRALAEAQMNFVATVSHELRTPLTVIRGAGHNLARGVVKEPEQIAEYSRLILRHADQLKDLVEQTLALVTNTSQTQQPRHRIPVQIDSILQEAISAMSEEIRAAGCTIDLTLPAQLPTVLADAASLQRAFQNLIGNAARHGAEGGWIGIAVTVIGKEPTSHLEVRISDRGPGIATEEQANIFKRFYRGKLAQERQVRGSGLGLSVVWDIVTAHDGNVEVESEQGKGATFIIRIPVHRS